MPLRFIFKSLPLDMQGDIFMKEAKQMIWPHCWRRAASASKPHRPLRQDKSSQPRDISMPGFWTCSPKCSFPLLVVGTHSAGLQHPTTPAFSFPFLASPTYWSSCLRTSTNPSPFHLGRSSTFPSRFILFVFFRSSSSHTLFPFEGLWLPTGMTE